MCNTRQDFSPPTLGMIGKTSRKTRTSMSRLQGTIHQCKGITYTPRKPTFRYHHLCERRSWRGWVKLSSLSRS